MERIKFEVIFNHNERASLDRPAWTSEQSSGMFTAFNHKHSMQGKRFRIDFNYYIRRAAKILQLLSGRR
jgi:hypothetical protein